MTEATERRAAADERRLRGNRGGGVRRGAADAVAAVVSPGRRFEFWGILDEGVMF